MHETIRKCVGNYLITATLVFPLPLGSNLLSSKSDSVSLPLTSQPLWLEFLEFFVLKRTIHSMSNEPYVMSRLYSAFQTWDFEKPVAISLLLNVINCRIKEWERGEKDFALGTEENERIVKSGLNLEDWRNVSNTNFYGSKYFLLKTILRSSLSFSLKF